MSSILRRTCYFDPSNNEIRWFPWNTVVTTLGAMYEPKNMSNFSSSGTLDNKDECAKIDELRVAERSKKWTFLGGGQVLHGGDCQPENYDFNY